MHNKICHKMCSLNQILVIYNKFNVQLLGHCVNIIYTQCFKNEKKL